MEGKYCIKCDLWLDINNFYKAGKFYYQSSCISCYNGLRIDKRKIDSYVRPLKNYGFDALSEKKKELIMELICYGYNDKEIARMVNISYYTFRYWKRRQKIPSYRDYFGSLDIILVV